MAKKVWITIKEYAERVEKTPRYVRTLIKKGKISKAALKAKGKKSFLINPAQADRDMKNNISYVNRRPVEQKGNPKKGITNRNKSEQQKTEQAGSGDGEPDSGIPEEYQKALERAGIGKIVPFSIAQTLKENYVAAAKKMDLEERRGDLLPKQDIELAYSELVLSARNKILSIKGLLAPLLKEFIDDSENFGIAMRSVDGVLRDVLQELADGGFRK